MAGSISLSLSQQFDSLGKPLSGGKLYFFASGTTTPQNAYQDSSLTILWPNPITLDDAGRVPAFYLADGAIKIRLADRNGETQVTADGLLVIGPSSGGGGGSPVDATTIFSTGDTKWRYGTGSHTGWIRFNGRTIGSATSGATERANADTQTLFEYLWNTDTNLTVSTGRGSTANADWVANKILTLPDVRSRSIAGLDDMGNAPAGILTTTLFTGLSPTTLGAVAGAEKKAIFQAHFPAVNFNVSGTLHGTMDDAFLTNGVSLAGGATAVWLQAGAGGLRTVTVPTTGLVVGSGGSGTALPSLSPYILMTLYGKL